MKRFVFPFTTTCIYSLGFLMMVATSGCSEPAYTYRCACNKIAYDAEGNVLEDASFNQVVCDTTENIDLSFEGELSELAQDCGQYFEGVEGIEQTDCTCTCDLIGECN